MRKQHALAIVAVCACGQPKKWSPSPAIGSIIVDDELVVRGEADDTISVMAHVALADHIAFGVVRLPHGDFAVAHSSPHLVLARARAWQAMALVLAMTPNEAYTATQNGIATLPACKTLIPPHVSVLEHNDPRAVAEEVQWLRRELVDRLGCYVADHVGDVW